MPQLDARPYDSDSDTIEIEGIRYSGGLFRDLGVHGITEGSLVRIGRRENGVVWLHSVRDAQAVYAGELYEVVRALVHVAEHGPHDPSPLDENSPLMDAARDALAKVQADHASA